VLAGTPILELCSCFIPDASSYPKRGATLRVRQSTSKRWSMAHTGTAGHPHKGPMHHIDMCPQCLAWTWPTTVPSPQHALR
jgi:hypothetical protein